MLDYFLTGLALSDRAAKDESKRIRQSYKLPKIGHQFKGNKAHVSILHQKNRMSTGKGHKRNGISVNTGNAGNDGNDGGQNYMAMQGINMGGKEKNGREIEGIKVDAVKRAKINLREKIMMYLNGN